MSSRARNLIPVALPLLVIAIAWSTAYGQSPATRPTHDPLPNLPSYGDALRRMLVSLAGIVAVLLVLAKVLPRFLGRTPFTPRSRLVQVMETYRLEPRKTLYLVKIADQYLLIGATADRLETLAGGPLDQEKIAAALKTQDASAAAPSPKPTPSFGELLDQKRPPSPQPRPTTPQ